MVIGCIVVLVVSFLASLAGAFVVVVNFRGGGVCCPVLPSAVVLHQTAHWQEFTDTLLDGVEDAFAKQQWYLPSIVERALIYQDTTVNPHQLLQTLDMSAQTRDQALKALTSSDSVVETVPSVLTRDECIQLQEYIQQHVQEELSFDNVDQCPDWQVNLDVPDLAQLIGPTAVDRLLHVTPAVADLVDSDNLQRVGVFLRVYQRNQRPWMPFHSDGNAFTVNVALNHDMEFQGGRLMVLTNHQLQVLERRQGDATVHRGSVYHAVSAMQGTMEERRYSMILFLHSKET